MIGLTSKQSQLLRYIKERMAGGGVSPSFGEMKAAIGLTSTSRVYALLEALEERGHIRRMRFRNRAIELVNPLEAVPWPELIAECRRRGLKVEVRP